MNMTETLFLFHISDILKDSNYKLTQFEDDEIEAFNSSDGFYFINFR
jgi:hypothetical protein